MVEVVVEVGVGVEVVVGLEVEGVVEVVVEIGDVVVVEIEVVVGVGVEDALNAQSIESWGELDEKPKTWVEVEVGVEVGLEVGIEVVGGGEVVVGLEIVGEIVGEVGLEIVGEIVGEIVVEVVVGLNVEGVVEVAVEVGDVLDEKSNSNYRKETMPQYVDRAGAYRGVVTEYGLKEHKKEGSVSYSLNVVVALHEFWDTPNEQWLDWRESEIIANGFLNVIKKNGNLNESQVVPIMEHGGWNGSFDSLQDQTWKPVPCQFDVKLNSYNDTFQVDWFAAYDRVPGGLGNCDAKKAKELDTRLRSSLKAISGNAKRAETPPEGKPPTPPSGRPADRPDDDIPF